MRNSESTFVPNFAALGLESGVRKTGTQRAVALADVVEIVRARPARLQFAWKHLQFSKRGTPFA